jgi:hypothetical protein
MKKLLIAAALLACAGIVTAVTSQNIVGYTKVTASDDALTLVALNFSTPSSTNINTLIGDQLPADSRLHIWDKTSNTYNTVTYTETRAGASWPDVGMDIGDAFWIEVAPGGGTHEVTLSGEVKGDDLSTTIGGPIDATGYFYPVDQTWGDTDLSAIMPADSRLHLWSGSNYVTYTKSETRAGAVWSAEALDEKIAPAEGFWVETPATNWTEELPYTP